MRDLVPIVFLAWGGCLEPTEVKLVLDTDVPCASVPADGIKVFVAPADKLASEMSERTVVQCKQGNLGMLVLVPSGPRDKIGVRITMATAPDANCTEAANYKKCVVGRRIVSFVDHTPLTLPISLQSSCIDQPCDATRTCVNGACVDATVDPMTCAKPGGCALGGSDAGADSGPVDAGPKPTVVSVTAGTSTTCALLSNGTTWCWGDDQQDQLALKPSVPLAATPTLNLTAGSPRMIALGLGPFGCMVDSANIVECWGAQGLGNLGETLTPNNTTRAMPMPVGSNITAQWVGPGVNHGCFVSQTNIVHCWGVGNPVEELGRGPAPSSPHVPGPIVNPPALMLRVVSGNQFSCALGKDGKAYCWGINANGQLGQGASGMASASPLAVNVTGVDLIAAGFAHTCAAATNGTTVQCWGANGQSQCGDPNLSDKPTPVVLVVGKPVQAIATGTRHSCAVIGPGDVVCWGGQSAGELGDGTGSGISATPVSTKLSGMLGVTAGENHTCAWNATSVWCWGMNDRGQLGTGQKSTMSYVPVQIPNFP